MLPKHQRLTNGRDFKRVYQKGSFFSASLLSLNWIPNKTNTTRIGVVVGKKIAAKATTRNTLKRRFREAAHKLYPEIPAGLDVAIVIKEKAKDANFSDIEKEMSQLVKKIGKNEKDIN